MGYAAIVHVVDDDERFRTALGRLLSAIGYRVQTYASATAFLSVERPDAPGCVITDVRMPGMSGLTLQKELATMSQNLPVILMTGFGDVPMCVRAMKAGAVDFLTKPFRDQDLLDAVVEAIHISTQQRARSAHLVPLQSRYSRLSPRERQVMELVTIGKLNKQVAAVLSISEITVKMHRCAAMRKMNATSLAELSRMAEVLGVAPAM